jgi:hypothetical protein
MTSITEDYRPFIGYSRHIEEYLRGLYPTIMNNSPLLGVFYFKNAEKAALVAYSPSKRPLDSLIYPI